MSNINTQGFGIQLAPAGFSLEANKIFENYAAALEFVKTKPAAYVGSIIAVLAPSTIEEVTYPKGAYLVEVIGEDAVLTQVGKETDLSGYVAKSEVNLVGIDTVIKTDKTGKIHVDTIGNAATANEAGHATSADSATEATHATSADSATEATHATSADNATNATTAEHLNWDNAKEYIVIESGYSSGENSDTLAVRSTNSVVKYHTYNTLFLKDTVINADANAYFALKFPADDLNETYEIISVKSNGFAIPMTKGSDNVYRSNSMFTKATVVENVEIVIRKK